MEVVREILDHKYLIFAVVPLMWVVWALFLRGAILLTNKIVSPSARVPGMIEAMVVVMIITLANAGLYMVFYVLDTSDEGHRVLRMSLMPISFFVLVAILMARLPATLPRASMITLG